MEDKFLMAQANQLDKTPNEAIQPNDVSPELRERLLAAAIADVFSFGSEFSERPSSGTKTDFSSLAAEYRLRVDAGIAAGLFQPGGVRPKDHLLFWAFMRFVSPKLYVESGVRAGSSLHGFSDTPSLERIVAIDPDLSQLRLPNDAAAGIEFIDDRDFSELDFAGAASPRVVYFDDHINAARRILQAHAQGFRYVLMDDSPGLEGMCQRIHPAFPTVPMIMRPDIFRLGDSVSWSYQSNFEKTASAPPSIKRAVKASIKRRTGLGDSTPRAMRMHFEIDADVVEQCRQARECVKRYRRLPDLGDYVPQRHFEKMIDTSKYLLELELPTG